MSKNSGYLVETKTGKKGRTYHKEKLVNKKTVVHLYDENDIDTGVRMLCDPKSLKINGFID